MDKTKLKEIIEKHQLWLFDKEGGERANLRRVDLSGADLRRVDLSGADLRRANLRRADLRRANLSGADLSGADLRRANLSDADLSGADLSGADLRRANLSDADLSGADLSGASTSQKYISVTHIGSRCGMTTYSFSENKIWCGCFTGTLEEFETKVKQTHAENTIFLGEYLGFINYLKSLKKLYCMEDNNAG